MSKKATVLRWVMPFLRLIVGLAILAGAVYLAKDWKDNPPETQRRGAQPSMLVVETGPLVPSNERILIHSQGTVEALTQTTLIPEVSGRVVYVSPSLRAGGTFREGEVLVKIEDVDYQTALVAASGTIFQAMSTYENERARGDLALREWRRSGNVKAPSEFYLRKPQIAAAQAAVATGRANLQQAERDVARTKISAPYAGRVQVKNVDVGQYVTPGTRLVEISRRTRRRFGCR